MLGKEVILFVFLFGFFSLLHGFFMVQGCLIEWHAPLGHGGSSVNTSAFIRPQETEVLMP